MLTLNLEPQIKAQHIIDCTKVCNGIGITVEAKRGRRAGTETIVIVLVEGRSLVCHSRAGHRCLTEAMCEQRRYHPRQAVAAGEGRSLEIGERTGKL